MVRKTKEEAQATREQLLDAAERAFCEHGVARTSLQEIACAAGLTRGAVYWHFENKGELLSALWERVSLPMEQTFEEFDSSHRDEPLQRLRFKAVAVLSQIARDERFRALMSIVLLKCEYADETSGVRQRLVEGRESCLRQTTEDFRHAIALAQLPATLDAEQAAFGLFGLIDGLAFHWLIAPERFSLDKDPAVWIDAYLNGLTCSAQAPIGAQKVGVAK